MQGIGGHQSWIPNPITWIHLIQRDDGSRSKTIDYIKNLDKLTMLYTTQLHLTNNVYFSVVDSQSLAKKWKLSYTCKEKVESNNACLVQMLHMTFE